MNRRPREIGLALGGGGVRGAAHVPVIELLDELGLSPTRITGSSIGAIIGALYAAGLSGKDIREILVRKQAPRDLKWKTIVDKKDDLLRWAAAFVPDLKGGGLLKSERFLDMIFEDLGPLRFEDLRIPLHIVATEYWTGREFVFDSGDVLLAIRASMAIPGVFAPVAWQGNLLIDGGISNQVPYEILLDQCDLTIAVDVGQQRIQQGEKRPDRIDLLVGSFEIVQERLLEERMKHRPPDIYIHPAMRDIDLLDFDKISNALEQARPAVAELKTRLEALLNSWHGPRKASKIKGFVADNG